MTVAYLLTVASVLGLVLFLAHLVREIRAETMVQTVQKEASAALRRVLSEVDHPAFAASLGVAPPVDAVPIMARTSGFLIQVDEAELCNSALCTMIGVRADGRKELVALTDGFRESHESWADLLRDCRRRGMRAPILAVGDDALGFLESATRRLPADEGAALLVPQAGECPCCASEVGTSGRWRR